MRRIARAVTEPSGYFADAPIARVGTGSICKAFFCSCFVHKLSLKLWKCNTLEFFEELLSKQGHSTGESDKLIRLDTHRSQGGLNEA